MDSGADLKMDFTEFGHNGCWGQRQPSTEEKAWFLAPPMSR